MEFKDTVFARRSNRFLLEKPLKKEEIDYILSIAFRAPVALGRYSDVKLLVITGNTLMTLQNEFVKVNGNDNTYGGSALIVVLHKGTREELTNQDAGIIGEHICLAAADINIGSVYLHSLVDMMNENKFINTLKMHGTNLVYYKDENLIKIHLHTFTPGWLLNYTQQFGEFQQVKIENMAQSHNEYTLFADLKEKLNLNSETKESQIFSSNTKDEAKEAPLKEYGMIATCSGDGVAAMFKEIGVDIIVSGGQTMNPSTEDFVSAIRKVRAKHVFIFPNNSNIVMAATQACDVCKKEVKAKVIASTTVPQGLVASMMLNPDADYSENAREMKKALKNVKSASITYATKDTQIGNIKVIKDQFIALIDKKIICCVEDKYDALYRTLDKLINDSSSIVTVFTGEDISEEETEKLSEELNTKYDMIEVDVKKGNQPVYSFIIGVE